MTTLAATCRFRPTATSTSINVDSINVARRADLDDDGGMSTLIGADEAAATLGVTKPSLYAYVSRGLIGRRVAVDGRTSLYDRDEVEGLARRSRRGGPVERPSIDVKIATSITLLEDDSPLVRGHRLVDLARTATYEQVAELLFTGDLPATPPAWPLDRAALARAGNACAALAPVPPMTALAVACAALEPTDDAPTAARRWLAIAPSVLGGPQRGTTAQRLARAWTRHPSPELITAVDRALVLLADHELATSTLAVRVAASVRTNPASALATGLHAVAGRLHGAASEAAADLFDRAAAVGAAAAVRDDLDAGRRLAGFGHSVYRRGDPRFEPLMEAVRAIPTEPSRLALVDEVVAEAGRSIGHLPNIDLALGALFVVGGLPRDAPLFAVARMAGWAAHYCEEVDERPVRFRGMARPR